MTRQKTSIFLIFINATALLFLAGCAKYKPNRLKPIEQKTLHAQEEKHNIELSLEAFNDEKFKNQFADFQVLSLTIKNKTEQSYLVDPDSFSLNLASPAEVQKKAPSLYTCYFIPSIALGIFGFIFTWEIGIPVATVFSLWGYQKSKLANKKQLKQISKNSLSIEKAAVINPRSTYTTLIFVPKKSYSPKFEIILKNQTDESSVIFDILITAHTHKIYTLK